MKTLRRLHLYLGCFFAPLILFFAVSGAWQVFGVHQFSGGHHPPASIALLSTLHTGHGLKSEPSTLSSPAMRFVVVAMTAALTVTILLGIIMAFRFGHRAAALACLGGGIGVPAALVLHQLYG